MSLKKPLPAPITYTLLRAAARELPQGSLKAIEVCLRCWVENRLDDSELKATFRSFAGASRALRDVFLPSSPRPSTPRSADPSSRQPGGWGEQLASELATKEQMRDLAMTARAASYCI